MEEVFDQSTLADRFDSDDEGLSKPKRRTMAPNVNPLTAMRKVTLKRLFVDSRDRNRAFYPNANDFRMSMTVPIRNVRAITLTNAKIPIVQGYSYAAVVLTNLKDRTLFLPKESPGLPAGVMAIIPLIPNVQGDNFAYFTSNSNPKSGGSQGSWRIAFPQGMAMLNELHFRLLTWDWNGALLAPSTIPLPLNAEANVAVAPDVDNNIFMQIEIEHEIQ